MDNIQQYFNCGKVNINFQNYTAEFLVDRLEDLKTKIVPHFQNYPVFCAKLHAFNLFKEIVIALSNKDKRTIEGRRELLKMALSMNSTTNRKEDRINHLFSLLDVVDSKEKLLFPNKNINITTPVTPDNISGIIDGDGSFYVSFQADGQIKTGFNITTDKASKALLNNIQTELKGIGTILEGTKNELVFTVTGLNQITEVLIPFVDLHPLFSERALHYLKFKEVSLILKKERPLSLDSKLEIVELCYEMNKKGKRRMFSKAEYINLLKRLHGK